jgi:hypothetical protein
MIIFSSSHPTLDARHRVYVCQWRVNAMTLIFRHYLVPFF